MTFGTLQTTDVLYFQGFLAIAFIVQGYQSVVVFVTGGIHVGFPVTVDTPAHRQGRALLYHFHLLDLTVALLALHATHVYVLRVVEISQVWQVMHPYPLNGGIFFDGGINLLNLW